MGGVLLNESRRVLVPAATHDETNCTSAAPARRAGGGRPWWAQARFRSINNGLTILRNQIEEFLSWMWAGAVLTKRRFRRRVRASCAYSARHTCGLHQATLDADNAEGVTSSQDEDPAGSQARQVEQARSGA